MKKSEILATLAVAVLLALVFGIPVGAWLQTLSRKANFDLAAWSQAVFSIFGIGVAIYVPWAIHRREQHASDQARNTYRNILRDAFTTLREPLLYLSRARALFDLVEDGGYQENDLQSFAANLRDAIFSLRESLAVIDELDDINRLDRFGAVRAIFFFRRAAKANLSTFEGEDNWLHDHQTEAVCRNAANNLEEPATELLNRVDDVIAAI
jgi:hypothetical protein